MGWSGSVGSISDCDDLLFLHSQFKFELQDSHEKLHPYLVQHQVYQNILTVPLHHLLSFAILFVISGVFGPCLTYFHFQVFSDNDEEDLSPEDEKWKSDCSRLLEFRQTQSVNRICKI